MKKRREIQEKNCFLKSIEHIKAITKPKENKIVEKKNTMFLKHKSVTCFHGRKNLKPF